VEAHVATTGGGRPLVGRSSLSRLPDRALKYGLTALSLGVLALLAFFFIRLYVEANPAFSKFGIDFVFGNNWDVANNVFNALPLVVGTLITSALALLIGVPIAVATAVFLVELCPARAKTPLTIMVDLLAAVPSVVYGLWGFYFLIPKLRPIEQWFTDTFSFIPFLGGAGTIAGPNYFIAGLVLAIMILPIVSAISREVLTTVPADHKEAALALGMTRWEMIKTAMLPYSRRGIVGGSMLGLGRAIGETIAVVIVIGDAPVIGKNVFDQGYTLASVIANEFGEAASQPLHRAALIGAGLVLFVLTFVVNAIARLIVSRSEREGEVRLTETAELGA
jgi:phosphate ABC transporter permease protein PstC